jgi:hypothetical protein
MLPISSLMRSTSSVTLANAKRRLLTLCSLFALLSVTLSATPATAQTLKMIAPIESAAFDRVGQSVSASGTRLAIGAPLSDGTFTDSGAVYIYESRNPDPVFDARLTAGDQSSASNFGFSVSVSGDFLAVGAPRETRGGLSQAGSAYLFQRTSSGWVQLAKLISPAAASLERFGHAVALMGNNLLVSAPGNSNQSGAVYRFAKISEVWTLQETWVAPIPTPGHNFGYSLALNNSWAAVGMLQNAPEGTSPGEVTLFLNMGGSWSVAQRISEAGAQLDDRFGVSLSLSGNSLLVGAMGLASGAINNGGAVVFELQAGLWTQTQVLTPAITQANQFAGQSVAHTPNRIFFGAPYANGAAVAAGKVFAFRKVGPVYSSYATYQASAQEAQDLFGSSVAATTIGLQPLLLLGAPGDNARGSRSGVAYVLRSKLSVQAATHLAYAVLACPHPEPC